MAATTFHSNNLHRPYNVAPNPLEQKSGNATSCCPNGASREHSCGRYVIRTEWRGKTLLYEVLTKSGQLVAAGIDLLSVSEERALEGIADRLCGGRVNAA
jgi:hypothetical protein